MDIPEMKTLVQESWAKVKPIGHAVPGIFYPKLFEIDPSTKPLFNEKTLEQQGEKLMKALTLSVDGLDNLETLIPKLAALGKRHANYKVSDAMYDSVGAALIYTLATGLDKEFTPKVKEAWVKVYGIIGSVMRPAMAEEYAVIESKNTAPPAAAKSSSPGVRLALGSVAVVVAAFFLNMT